MASPFHRLKFLPWGSLLLVAALTVSIVMTLEFLTIVGAKEVLAIRSTLTILSAPPLGSILPILASVGLGALSVFLLEKFYPEFIINLSLLWALVGCIFVVLLVKYLLGFVLPVPVLLIDWSETVVLGTIVGIFWKGRPYWYR